MEILKTTDYDMFKLLEDNRDIKDARVARLVLMIQDCNDLHLHPIIVNKNMEVIDGQTRLSAAKMLEVPIYYIVDENYSSKKMITINTSQDSWTVADFMKYWLIHGSEEYLKLKNFMDETNFSLQICLRWNGEGGEDTKMFKEGKFEFKVQPKHRRAIDAVLRFIEFLRDTGFRAERMYQSRNFHQASKIFFMDQKVDHERFFDRLERCPIRFKYVIGKDDYVRQFVDIYNYDMRKNKLEIVYERGTLKLR